MPSEQEKLGQEILDLADAAGVSAAQAHDAILSGKHLIVSPHVSADNGTGDQGHGEGDSSDTDASTRTNDNLHGDPAEALKNEHQRQIEQEIIRGQVAKDRRCPVEFRFPGEAMSVRCELPYGHKGVHQHGGYNMHVPRPQRFWDQPLRRDPEDTKELARRALEAEEQHCGSRRNSLSDEVPCYLPRGHEGRHRGWCIGGGEISWA